MFGVKSVLSDKFRNNGLQHTTVTPHNIVALS
jgi:hypothetical protein